MYATCYPNVSTFSLYGIQKLFPYWFTYFIILFLLLWFLYCLSQFSAEFLLKVGGHLVHHSLYLLVLKGLFIILEGDGDGV